MKIEILGCDSLGARSMATYVEEGDFSLIIDPSVALGPKRYNLPPHPVEFRLKESIWSVIEKRLKSARFVVVTHYHHDHFNPESVELFRGKVVFLKEFDKNINKNQQNRARAFYNSIKDVVDDIIFCDSKSFVIDNVRLEFSDAVYHGADRKLGFVVQVFVKGTDLSFLFSSDVQGFPLKDHLFFVKDKDPDVIFCDGPLTYMSGNNFDTNFKKSLENMMIILNECKVKYFVIDHHLTRDRDFALKIAPLVSMGIELNKKVLCASDYMGYASTFVEANRDKLWLDEDYLKKIYTLSSFL